MSPRLIIAYSLAALLSVLLMLASWRQLVPLDPTETLGFVSGAWGVWLTVKEHIWNWPIGIINSAFYLVIFAQARLFADASLQFIYIVLGFLGWYWWLRGGENRGVLTVKRATVPEISALLALLVVSTAVLTAILVQVHDSAPFWDAFTTMLSLVAQYMLTRKLLENWYLWITADLIYIVLYASRALPLTAVLYLLYLLMCIAGVRAWRRSAHEHPLPMVPRTQAELEVYHA